MAYLSFEISVRCEIQGDLRIHEKTTKEGKGFQQYVKGFTCS